MRAKLFPGSATKPISAFSFSVLKGYDLHSLQAKISAWDYCLALRRLTDNVFTHLVNDPYQVFMRIAWFWRFIKSRARLGQEHGIDRCFPRRPPGFLLVPCPACPDPGLNMDGEWWRSPLFLSDGNHQINQFSKNTNPFDQSLYEGCSYFPEARRYNEFLHSLGCISAEECAAACNHIKVINLQGRLQNQNCALTGGVNTQCDHVFVMATSNMQNAYPLFTMNASFHHAYSMLGFDDKKIDNHCQDVHHADCYDSMCHYYSKKGKRFAQSTYLEDQKEFTVEYYWVELNQVGGYTRQMNGGHREDTIIAHHHDWNWRKTVNMGETSNLFCI
ncbi:hypothetical protein K435DRAFT_821464 [Dendrothele bispora CBS 962.96]|uniref:CxC2-like cysteine cluster KDZ transposase-associated domain-containing protein n=1 Tax=Dendrothele bispora (strain CBS 962.96) TaxID=1314807 RepID=A0A4S8LJX7_DENBC|nr:hypothetical protein K435DRAFT_821464 [Dendrothele bispora CBS 962.96]